MLENSKAALVSKQTYLESNMKSKANNKNEGQKEVIIPSLTDDKSALASLKETTGCSMEQINTLSNKITYILEEVLKNFHEDKTNKIDMLRKIENELLYLSEKREYIANKPRVGGPDSKGGP